MSLNNAISRLSWGGGSFLWEAGFEIACGIVRIVHKIGKSHINNAVRYFYFFHTPAILPQMFSWKSAIFFLFRNFAKFVNLLRKKLRISSNDHGKLSWISLKVSEKVRNFLQSVVEKKSPYFNNRLRKAITNFVKRLLTLSIDYRKKITNFGKRSRKQIANYVN